MNGRESAVGTYLAYQARGVMVNQNSRELRCKKKELWIFHHILWKTNDSFGESAPCRKPRNEEIRFRPPGARRPYLGIDMQLLFAGTTAWYVQRMYRAFPAVRHLAEARPHPPGSQALSQKINAASMAAIVASWR